MEKNITINNQVQSLCWINGDLYDYSAGDIIHPDTGAVDRIGYLLGGFDRSICSENGEYSVVYNLLGTKGLILKNKKIIREINRSYYHADVYEYPICIFKIPDGRTVIAHCPNQYNKLEIEEIETGKCLTKRDYNKCNIDFFHSRLTTSPDGRYLLSSGWIWHPVDHIMVFDIYEALKNPSELDSDHLRNTSLLYDTEINSADFIDNENILLNTVMDEDENQRFLKVLNIKKNIIVTSIKHNNKLGEIKVIDNDHTLSFYNHPKIIETSSGRIIHEWSNIDCGTRNSSIVMDEQIYPIIVIDMVNKKFAVAKDNRISIVEFNNI